MKEFCKAISCKHKASKPSGFCGWCDKKYKNRELLPDGREISKVCKAKTCDRPSKKKGFCGWCVKKFNKGELLADGTLSVSAAQKLVRQQRRQEKREFNSIKKEKEKLKDQVKLLLSSEKLKELQKKYPEYTRTIDCPYLDIYISPAACFDRIFLRKKTKSLNKCKKCSYHDDDLVVLKTRLKSKDENIRMHYDERSEREKGQSQNPT